MFFLSLLNVSLKVTTASGGTDAVDSNDNHHLQPIKKMERCTHWPHPNNFLCLTDWSPNKKDVQLPTSWLLQEAVDDYASTALCIICLTDIIFSLRLTCQPVHADTRAFKEKRENAKSNSMRQRDINDFSWTQDLELNHIMLLLLSKAELVSWIMRTVLRRTSMDFFLSETTFVILTKSYLPQIHTVVITNPH